MFPKLEISRALVTDPKLILLDEPFSGVDPIAVEDLQIEVRRLKNEFGTVFEQAIRSGAVAITKHDTARAVLISVEEFEALVGERSNSLDKLSGQFEGLLARMQTSAAKKGIAAAFKASPKALGRAAVKAARK